MSSVTVYDPDWLDEDVDALLALRRYEAALCPGCHRPLAETTDPEHDRGYYYAEAVTCHACAARELAQKADAKKDRVGAVYPIEERPVPDA